MLMGYRYACATFLTSAGRVRGDDGSLTVHIQHDEADTPEGRASWLPAPEVPMYLVMRISGRSRQRSTAPGTRHRSNGSDRAIGADG